MKNLVRINENDNHVRIKFDGPLLVVNIFNSASQLYQVHRLGENQKEIVFFGRPGTYYIEANAAIIEVKSAFQEVRISDRVQVQTFGDAQSFQFIINGIITRKSSLQEGVQLGKISLESLKSALIASFKKQGAEYKKRLFDDEIVQEAALGILDESTSAAVKATMLAFKKERERLQQAVARAKSVDDLFKIAPAFPDKMVQPPKPRARQQKAAPKKDTSK
jgi:hypothetical protein